MKNKILLMMLMAFTIQCSTAQNLNVSDFPNKIVGKWRLLSYNNTLEIYEETDNYYEFKGNNILEEYNGNTLLSTLNYEISFMDNSYNGLYVRIANIKITDSLFGSIINYQLDIFIDKDSILRLALEQEKTAVNSLYIKI